MTAPVVGRSYSSDTVFVGHLLGQARDFIIPVLVYDIIQLSDGTTRAVRETSPAPANVVLFPRTGKRAARDGAA